MKQSSRRRRPPRGNPRSGIALLLSVLVLMVVIAIVFQIQISTMTSARVARNDVGLTAMDLAIESAALQVFDGLESDAEASAGGGGGAAGAMPGGGGDPAQPGTDAAAGAESAAASDSREDEWARPQRSEVNDIQLRILVQDEDAKYNVLNLLAEDEDRAEEALEIVKRILDQCREGTREDISAGEAEDMARAMLAYMTERDRFERARPALLTEVEGEPNRVLPLSLREFLTLEPFEERHFQDYRDEEGVIVHSIGSYLTLWSSPGTKADESGTSAGASGSSAEGDAGNAGSDGEEGDSSGTEGAGGGAQEPGAGGGSDSAGYGVNVNTAAPVVLKSLFDRRDVSPRFWDDVIEYRNQEEEEQEGEEESETEPQYDEYGQEIVPRKFFDTLEELSELGGWEDENGEMQEKIRGLLTTQSHVFSLYITARRSTAGEESELENLSGPERAREEEEAGNALVRTVRMVVWRRAGEEAPEIVPIIPWDVLDYAPFEVLDFPDERR